MAQVGSSPKFVHSLMIKIIVFRNTYNSYFHIMNDLQSYVAPHTFSAHSYIFPIKLWVTFWPSLGTLFVECSHGALELWDCFSLGTQIMRWGSTTLGRIRNLWKVKLGFWEEILWLQGEAGLLALWGEVEWGSSAARRPWALRIDLGVLERNPAAEQGQTGQGGARSTNISP